MNHSEETSAKPKVYEAGDLMPLVYDQLRALARHRMSSEATGHTLQATALVHEAYVRLAGDGARRFSSRGQFYRLAAESMRRILIEHARAKGRVKRGAGARREFLNLLDLASLPDSQEILSFDEAIQRLEEHMPSAASVVRLRFYAGLSVDQTAETLGVSSRTVNREWVYARAWLFRCLDGK
jgi:RNA polymerase sigma factor (TIGR02999 family)